MIFQQIHGVEVPALGFGTWQLSGTTCRDAVADALEIGYRHLDTARMYQNEEEVGRAIRESGLDRGDLFVTSKVWQDFLHRDDFITETEKSLSALGIDYLDLVLIHWPNLEVDVEETLDAMASLQERGLLRHGGVSNFPPALLERALRHYPVFCNQVEYYVLLGQEKLRAICETHDVMLTAYCPLGQGEIIDHEVLVAIGAAHGKSAAQVALRWLLQQPKVTTVPRSSSPQRRRENFDLFDFELSQAEMRQIDDLPKDRRRSNPPFAPDWEMAAG
ncbi:MAG: aldo/keto reductase [Verrucomicrobiota bacterium]